MSDSGYPGWVDTHEMGSDFGTLSFLVRQAMAGANHVTVVQVKAVHGGGIAAPPTVDVQPLIAQIDQQGTAQVHGTIYGMPTMRIQGGPSAIVIDPLVGDIGVVIFADRDISSAMKNQGPSNPGSWRRFDWADGLYIGSVSYITPTSFVQILAGNINVTATEHVVVNAPTSATINSPIITMMGGNSTTTAVTIDGTLDVTGATIIGGTLVGAVTATFTGDVIGAGISLETHPHSGVTTGAGVSGPPV